MDKLPSSVKTAFFTVLFIFVFLYLFTKLLGPIPFSVNSINTTKTDLFTVQGLGEETAVPDTVYMNVGVTKSASTVKSAQDQVNSAVNNITQNLKNLGIEEKKIKTTNFSIHPNYDYSDGKESFRDYKVTQNLRIEVTPVEKANEALDLASENGANMVGDLQFTINDDKREVLENKAREKAVKKAKEKAGRIARSAGIKLGRIINVQDAGNNYYPQPYYDNLRALPGAEEAAQKTELQPGETTIRVTVTLSYETL